MSKVKKSKKLHVEITRKNIESIKLAITTFNGNPDRITPEIKTDHIINQALDFYLREKGC